MSAGGLRRLNSARPSRNPPSTTRNTREGGESVASGAEAGAGSGATGRNLRPAPAASTARSQAESVSQPGVPSTIAEPIRPADTQSAVASHARSAGIRPYPRLTRHDAHFHSQISASAEMARRTQTGSSRGSLSRDIHVSTGPGYKGHAILGEEGAEFNT
jgi:hypothetical protein